MGVQDIGDTRNVNLYLRDDFLGDWTGCRTKWAEWAALANAADSGHFFYFPLQSPSSPVSLSF